MVHFNLNKIFFIKGGQVSIRHNLKGPNLAPSTACAAGSHAIGEAYNMIRLGT